MALGIGPAESGQDPLLGRDIGGVRIVRLIAEGGMGRVYEGKQEKPNRTVAVKVMRPGLTSPSILKRFEYEAEVLGRLQHPGIAHIYSVGVHQLGNATVPYFVMEYIADARTLTKYAADLKLPTRQRLDLFRSVCDAVAHGHQKGVIHRDLKPSNILVDAAGQPKVIDFGVARATDSDMALTTMQTDVGQLIGTLQYMSPEQFKADPNDIDVRSDVYALGVILYELLAGKMPYDVKKKAIHEVARIVQEDDPTPLSSFNRALKGDVGVIAGKCLEKDRGRRYSSASELGADLGRYLTGEPISASPPGFVDGLVRLAKKHRAAAAAVAGVFSAIVVAVIGIGIFAGRADEARRRAEAAQLVAEQERQKSELAQATSEEERKQAVHARATAEAAEKRAVQEKVVATKRLYEANFYRLQSMIKEHGFDLARALFQEMSAGYERSTLPIELACLRAQIDQAVAVCQADGSGVWCMAFSPDSRMLATGSQDKIARLWEAATGQCLAMLEGHAGVIQMLAFSPDGSRLATASHDGRDDVVRLWDVRTVKKLAEFKASEKALSEEEAKLAEAGWFCANSIRSIAFSPDGTQLATASHDKTARLWDAITGKQQVIFNGHMGSVTTLAFAADGQRLATGSDDKTVRLWDVATGEQLALLQGHKDRVTAVAPSPDGLRLASASADGTARLWDVATGKLLVSFEGHKAAIVAIAFSSDGSRLATGSQDNTVRLWDTTTGNQLVLLEGQAKSIGAIVFSPDDRRLATQHAGDNSARLWDAATGAQLAVLPGHAGAIFDLAFSPDGSRIATASADGTVRLWNAESDKPLNVLQGHTGSIGSVAISPAGTWLATGGQDKTARVWDIATGKELAALKGHAGMIMDVAFSPDGEWLATASEDMTARVWDMVSGKQLTILKGHAAKIHCLTFSPKGMRLATGSNDNTARLWDAISGKQLVVFQGHEGYVCAVAFSPDGARFATASTDKTARLWDAATGRQLAVLRGHQDIVCAIAFSPDGERLATASEDKTARVWDAATGKQAALLSHSEDTSDEIIWRINSEPLPTALVFSPDGRQLATSCRYKTARLWDVPTGELLAVLKGHSGWITQLAFSPDGSRLATGSQDNTARIWDTTTGKPFTVLAGHDGAVRSIAFSPDGTRLATGSGDKTARLWGVSNADTYKARQENAVIEERLENDVSTWLKDGPDAAAALLKEAKNKMPPEDYRVAANMVLEACAGGEKNQ